MFKRLVLASHNKKKTSELRAILQPLGVELLSLSDFPDSVAPEEDGDTFEANAAIKASAALEFTGLPSVADDSGLVVPALGGEPGVWSARYAGEDADDAANNRLLLERMSGFHGEQRRGSFISVVALAAPGNEVKTFRGETWGSMLMEVRGEGGFGYDPLFLSDDLGQTFAEANAEDKNRVSHRGRALAKLLDFLGAEK